MTQTHQPKNGRRRAERAHAQPRNTETVASEREQVAFLLPRRESFCKMGSPQKARPVSPTVLCTGCANPGGSRGACPSPALQAAWKVQTWPPGQTLCGTSAWLASKAKLLTTALRGSGSRLPKIPRGIGAGSRHHTGNTRQHSSLILLQVPSVCPGHGQL